jgi:hypothetical protein
MQIVYKSFENHGSQRRRERRRRKSQTKEKNRDKLRAMENSTTTLA